MSGSHGSLTSLDDYHGASPQLVGEYVRGFAITPSDATPLPRVTRGIRVLTSGNINVVFAASGESAIVIPVSAGETLAFRLRQVLATGTTATLIGLA